MLDDALSGQGRIGVRMPVASFSVAPGSSVTVRIQIINRGAEDDISLTVSGIPTHWVSMPSPIVRMAAGEEREVSLNIQPPPPPNAQAGRYPFAIRAASRLAPEQADTAEGVLTVAALEVEGRIGLLMASTGFSVVPGSRVTVPIVLLNRGLEEDVFQLSVEGIPATWVSTGAATTRLSPGQQRQVELTIQPPRSVQSRAGRHRLKIQVRSQAAPEQLTEAECILTVATFTQFGIRLHPQRLEAGKSGWVAVENQGNIQQSFTVSWNSPNDDLAFEPGPVQELRVSAGEVGTVEFRATPRGRPLFGGATSYALTARVESAERESKNASGEVAGRALLPMWVLPVVALVGLAAVVIAALFIAFGASDEAAPTATATPSVEAPSPTVPAQTEVPPVAPTEAVTEVPTEQPTEVPSPIPTEVPTEPPTAIPTAIPTATVEPTEPPTEVPTEVPTDVPTEVPTVPPVQDTGVLALESNRDGNPELYALNTADWSVFRLTIDPAVDTEPAWSPNGDKLAFATNRDGNFEIYAMNADGTAAVNLTNDPDADRYPTWSPDGEWIAFTTDRDGNQEIYVMRADGSEPRNVTNSPAEDYAPSWYAVSRLLSKDEGIAFTSDRDGNAEIYSMKVDGSEQVNLTNHPAVDVQPAWSSDGERILFTSNRDGNQEIYVMDGNGANQTNVTNSPAEDTQAAWSPDDAWIAFTSNRDGNQEVYSIASPDGDNADGLEPFNVTNNPAEDRYPAWIEPGR